MADLNNTAQGPQTLQTADGTNTETSIDSSAQYDALQANGIAEINFKSGNYKSFIARPQLIAGKIQVVQTTILPLIEAALIELLGNNKAYTPNNFNATFIEGETPQIDVALEYTVELFIGTDIDQKAISHDANYILSRISKNSTGQNILPNVSFKHCSIDCKTGNVEIEFIL